LTTSVWPLRAGELHIESEVVEVRPSKLLRNHGLIEVKPATQNQNDEAVQVQIANLVVPCRKSGERE
jgi:acyl dehydratase